MTGDELLRMGSPPCSEPPCVHPNGHAGPHAYGRLTCHHVEPNFVGLPGRAGKCKACRKTVRARAGIPGRTTRISKADLVEASAIDLDDPKTWPGQGVAAVVQPSRPAGLPGPPSPPASRPFLPGGSTDHRIAFASYKCPQCGKETVGALQIMGNEGKPVWKGCPDCWAKLMTELPERAELQAEVDRLREKVVEAEKLAARLLNLLEPDKAREIRAGTVKKEGG